MATLEKRITDLENVVTDETQVKVLLPDESGIYEVVRDDFKGKVMRVVFVESPNADRPVFEPGADHGTL